MTIRSLIVTLAIPVLVVQGLPAGAGPIDPQVDSAMEQDPLVPNPPPVDVFPDRLKTLWLEAFARPESDLKRLVAATIARAHRLGMPGLNEAIAPLAAALDQPDQHHVVRLAAAQALIALEARQSAPLLWRHAEDSLTLARIIEPALAEWDHEPAREAWLQRLRDSDVRHQKLLLAIEALGTVREPRAADRLLELALDRRRRPDIRLSAARSLGRIRDSGLEDSARSLAGDLSAAGLTDRLVAASLLARHESEAARRLLTELATDPQPAIAAVALRRLLEIDPELVVPLAPEAIRRDDPHVRTHGAESLIARPDAERIALLGTLLDDVHPDVRRFVRREMIKLSEQAALTEPVIQAAVKQLEGASWRGQEQATFVLVARDHQAAIPRLVELLENTRAEVMVTAAWALRRMEARDVLPQMLSRAERVTNIYAPPQGEPGEPLEGMDQQLAQLFEAFAQMDHRAAEPLMRRFIPKNFAYPVIPRSRAIWALGYFYAGSADPSLAKQFSERLNDVASMPPEFPPVRHACAISLGRMRAESALPVLRSFAATLAGDPVGYCCLWSIHQITGEPIPELEPQRRGYTWFLAPLGD